MVYIRPAQPFKCCGPLSHEKIYCQPQTFTLQATEMGFLRISGLTLLDKVNSADIR